MSGILDLDIEPSDSLHDIRSKVQTCVDCPLDEVRLVLGTDILDNDDKSATDLGITEGCTLTFVRTKGWDSLRLSMLRKLFVSKGEVHEVCLDKRRVHHDTKFAEGMSLPDVLKSLLRLGAKWNFRRGSCDVFGLNIWVTAPADTVEIFGDAECRQDWLERHGEDSCASAHWALLGASSEYDYYFVNLKTDDPQFGAVRRIVNNCDEEEVFTSAPFEHFMDLVERYAKANSGADCEADSEDDLPSFSRFESSKRRRIG